MTVTTATYAPVPITYVPGTFAYAFQLEIIGPAAFELWFLDDDGGRIRIATPDEYNVSFVGPPPLYDAGDFTLTREPPTGTVTLSVERNTPITQLADFGNFVAFPMDMIEFTLDKATMICQELDFRKCDAAASTEMTQLVDYEPYTPLYANQLEFSVQTIIDILNEIAGSAQDCSCVPEDT